MDRHLRFQYPLRVEVGCNENEPKRTDPHQGVSVPSTGRSGLQPGDARLGDVHQHCFSTLYGSKWVATCNIVKLFTYRLEVSVPSTGRSGLQLIVIARRRKKKKQFQYPLRVEVGCNTTTPRPRIRCPRFQYPLRVEVGCNLGARRKIAWDTLCFSTLYGSKWVATYCKSSTGRRLCSFSTLYGSKWVATQYTRWRRKCLLEFQYPLRVEVGCNLKPPLTPETGRRVSVPSTGRSGLQLGDRVTLLGKMNVSVPSTGRSGLQLARFPCLKSFVTRFSTLYGSKWVATPNGN